MTDDTTSNEPARGSPASPSSALVLSLFPGIGLLDRAFEEEGFTVVRGPDPFWGGDVRRFVPPAERFEGVIGGPPCQCFSDLRLLLDATGVETVAVDLVPEFVRCVEQARPRWWVMENVTKATEPAPAGYRVSKRIVKDWKCGGATQRKRAFWFGGIDVKIDQTHWPAGKIERAITRNARVPDERHIAKRKGRGGLLPGDGKYMAIERVNELQGLPRDWHKGLAFRTEAIRIMLGNGVPLAMGRAVARAVREAVEAGRT